MLALRRILPWFLVSLLLIRLTLLMWPHGNPLLLPMRMGWLDWMVVALLVGWAIWHFGFARRGPRHDPTLVAPFVRSWNEWHKTGMSVLDLEFEGARWTVRAASIPGERPGKAPTVVVELPPRCPKCGFAMAETRVKKDWFRDCTSTACRNHVISRQSFKSTVDLIVASSSEAWRMTAPTA